MMINKIDPDMHLPDFIIVGAAKAGTSACSYNLSRHPDIFIPRRKDKLRQLRFTKFLYDSEYMNHGEIKFFADKKFYGKGVDWYSGFFKHTNCRLKGEKTPQYLYSNYHFHEFNNKSCDRIKSFLPDVKIIILLRDPVDRAFSHWNHIQDKPIKSTRKYYLKPFYECITDGGENNNIVMFGCYYQNVLDYIETFGRDRMHIVIQERMMANMTLEYEKIFEFLGAPKIDKPDFKIIHKRDYKDRILDDSSIEYLEKYYRADVTCLKKLLQDDLPEWREYA